MSQYPTLEELRGMSKEEILAHGNPATALSKLTIVDVADPQESTNGNPYFTCRVQTGLNRVITRNFYGVNQPDGSIRWQNFSPEQAFVFMLMETDLSNQMHLETAEIEPEKIILPGGEVAQRDGQDVYVNQRTVIVVGEESLEQACRRSGSLPRKAVPERAFQSVGVNGLEPA